MRSLNEDLDNGKGTAFTVGLILFSHLLHVTSYPVKTEYSISHRKKPEDGKTVEVSDDYDDYAPVIDKRNVSEIPPSYGSEPLTYNEGHHHLEKGSNKTKISVTKNNEDSNDGHKYFFRLSDQPRPQPPPGLAKKMEKDLENQLKPSMSESIGSKDKETQLKSSLVSGEPSSPGWVDGSSQGQDLDVPPKDEAKEEMQIITKAPDESMYQNEDEKRKGNEPQKKRAKKRGKGKVYDEIQRLLRGEGEPGPVLVKDETSEEKQPQEIETNNQTKAANDKPTKEMREGEIPVAGKDEGPNVATDPASSSNPPDHYDTGLLRGDSQPVPNALLDESSDGKKANNITSNEESVAAVPQNVPTGESDGTAVNTESATGASTSSVQTAGTALNASSANDEPSSGWFKESSEAIGRKALRPVAEHDPHALNVDSKEKQAENTGQLVPKIEEIDGDNAAKATAAVTSTDETGDGIESNLHGKGEVNNSIKNKSLIGEDTEPGQTADGSEGEKDEENQINVNNVTESDANAQPIQTVSADKTIEKEEKRENSDTVSGSGPTPEKDEMTLFLLAYEKAKYGRNEEIVLSKENTGNKVKTLLGEEEGSHGSARSDPILSQREDKDVKSRYNAYLAEDESFARSALISPVKSQLGSTRSGSGLEFDVSTNSPVTLVTSIKPLQEKVAGPGGARIIPDTETTVRTTSDPPTVRATRRTIRYYSPFHMKATPSTPSTRFQTYVPFKEMLSMNENKRKRLKSPRTRGRRERIGLKSKVGDENEDVPESDGASERGAPNEPISGGETTTATESPTTTATEPTTVTEPAKVPRERGNYFKRLLRNEADYFTYYDVGFQIDDQAENSPYVFPQFTY